ncbi:MAG: outer membrane protein assembly factor BamD [Candidatus Eisenbacteria bacterium]
MIRNNASRLAGALLVVALLAATGCSTVPELGETTAEDTYEIGMAAAERGDHLLAIEAFKRITLNSPLHEMADDALVGIADAHRAISDYASAEEEYRRLLSDYPHSPLVPEAEYKLGVTFLDQALPAALDQTMTGQAISQFEYFLAAYPESGLADEARAKILELRTRLAAKSYDSATLYFDLGRPKAARVYLEAVVTEYPDTAWARVALLDKARSFAAEGSRALAENEYQRLIELYPGTEEARTAAAEKAVLSG